MTPSRKMIGGSNSASRAKITKRNTLCFYASIESRCRGNRLTVVVRERNENFFMTPTVCLHC